MVAGARELTKQFGNKTIFEEVSFDLEVGDVLLVTGPNGCGKSTLLKVMMGLIAPTAGRKFTPQAGELGYAALDQSLYGTLTVSEHLEWCSPSCDVAVLLKLCQLEKQGKLQSRALSTGQRARLKLAMAASRSPKLLVLDEPSAAMDDTGREVVADIIQRTVSIGAVLIATNDARDLSWGTHELKLDFGS